MTSPRERIPVLVIALIAMLLADLGIARLHGSGARVVQAICVLAMLAVVGLLARSARSS